MLNKKGMKGMKLSRKKAAVIAVVILLTAAGIAVKVLGGAKSAEGESAAILADVQQAEVKPITATVTAKGTAEIDSKEIIGAQSIAKVLEVTVEKGDEVKAGDVVIRYDPKSRETIEERLAEARLSLKAAQVSLEGATTGSQSTQTQAQISYEQDKEKLKTAQDTYDKNLILFEQGAISQSDLDGFKNALEDLQASVRLAEIKIKDREPDRQNAVAQTQVELEQRRLAVTQLEKQLREFKLTETSPIDGTVIDIYIENSAVTKEGDQLIMIGDMQDITIQTYLSEYDAPAVEAGQKVLLTGDALKNQTVEGRVKRVDPSAQERENANGSEKVIAAEIEIVGTGHKLKPGNSINAKIITAEMSDAVVVPIMAVVNEDDNKNFLFVVKKDDTLEKRAVDILTMATIEAAVSGVKEGETIVVNPAMTFAEGMKINPVRADDSGQPAGDK